MSDLARIFSTDPLLLSDRDVETLVNEFREKRKQFNFGNMSAGSSKPKSAKAKQAEATALNLDLDL